ncbi:MAG: chemotaxis protein CheW [Candidatus Margulisiibacteriota bacterium]
MPRKKKIEAGEVLRSAEGAEEDFYEENPPEEEKKQLIDFHLGKEWYGIEIIKVREVVKVPPITYLPGAPPYILGIANLRGNILSITDLKKIFGLGAVESSPANRIIVVEHEGIETGLLVDKIEKTLDLPVSKIDPPMATLEGPAAEYIEGEAEIEGKLLGILKIEKLIQKK